MLVLKNSEITGWIDHGLRWVEPAEQATKDYEI